MALKNERLKSENERLKSDNKLLNGCVEDCEDSIKDYEKLESENEKLKACVEFFSDIRNQKLNLSEFSSLEALQNLFDEVENKARKTLSELKPSEAMEKE
jgi:hypothetical protein